MVALIRVVLAFIPWLFKFLKGPFMKIFGKFFGIISKRVMMFAGAVVFFGSVLSTVYLSLDLLNDYLDIDPFSLEVYSVFVQMGAVDFIKSVFNFLVLDISFLFSVFVNLFLAKVLLKYFNILK